MWHMVFSLHEQCSCENSSKLNAFCVHVQYMQKGLLVNMSVTCAEHYSDSKDNSSPRGHATHFLACPLSNLCVIMIVMYIVYVLLTRLWTLYH